MYASFKACYVFLNVENKTNALQRGGKREEKEKKNGLWFFFYVLYVHISLSVGLMVSFKRAR